MKKTKHIFWTLLLAIQLLQIKGQNPVCLMPNLQVNTNQSNCPTENICYMGQFVPGPYHNTIYVRLNLWFLKPSSNPANPGVFNQVTQQGVDTLVAIINRNYNSLWAPKLKVYPTPQYIKKPKIQFVLNSFNLVVDSLLYAYNNDATSDFTSPLYVPYMSNTNAINIIYKVNSISYGGGAANGIPGNAIKYVYKDPSPANSWAPSGLEAGI